MLASLSENAKLRVHQAFRLSAATLADEPGQWPTQILARLQSDKSLEIQRVLQYVAESLEGCWLMPTIGEVLAYKSSDGGLPAGASALQAGLPANESAHTSLRRLLLSDPPNTTMRSRTGS